MKNRAAIRDRRAQRKSKHQNNVEKKYFKKPSNILLQKKKAFSSVFLGQLFHNFTFPGQLALPSSCEMGSVPPEKSGT